MRQSKAMGSIRKPVIVRKFSRDWVAGYAAAGFDSFQASLELLDTSGKTLNIEWEAVKWICYVRDLPSANSDRNNPERLLHRRFSVRPRSAGLWLHLTLNDGDEIEGLAANDRSLVDGAGLMLTPPDTRSNTQRIYVPRRAIQELEVLSLIGAGRHRGRVEPQPELFPSSSDNE
ncbi:MAG TPA: hypothetical protein VKR52_01945 [Terracidiphilus sp.]|nr:hypothetical protein [Terracidiphilus sp.]